MRRPTRPDNRAMDAMSLLGGMLGSGFGKGRGPGLGTVAGVAVGAAAVGGLGYLAYQHFKPGAQAGAPGVPQGAFGGQPPMGGPGGPPGGGGMLEGMLGSSGGMRTGDFASSGYGWQGGAAGAAPAPQQAWGAAPAQPQAPGAPSAGPATAAAAAVGAAPTMSAADYAKLPAMPVSPYDDTVAVQTPEIAEARKAIKAVQKQEEQQGQALLLVRAMVAAANADGAVDAKERADILARLDASGISPAERDGFVRELDAPKPVTALVGEVNTPELAEQFYMVSLMSMSVDTDAERAYARMLPALLNLTKEQVAAIHQKAGLPTAG